MANGEPRSTPAEELSEGNEEKKRSKDTENTNDIVSIEDDEEDKQPKPKPKKKRDSGYTKSLQEAMANLKMTDNQKQRRVSFIVCAGKQLFNPKLLNKQNFWLSNMYQPDC